MHPRNVEKWVFKYINSERKKRKLKPLEPHPALIKAARDFASYLAGWRILTHAVQMGMHEITIYTFAARSGYLGDNSKIIKGEMDEEILEYKFIKKGGFILDNLAKFYADPKDPSKKVARGIVNLWMNSEEHRKAILNRKVYEIGVGVSSVWSKKYKKYELYAVAAMGYRKKTLTEKIKGIISKL